MPAIPESIRKHLLLAEAASSALRDEALASQLSLRFTLDGRFVGDVAELLAVRCFELQLNNQQQARHDAVCQLNGKNFGVQVKCRRSSADIDFRTCPEILLVVEIDADWSRWEVVYNGPGTIVTDGRDLKVDAEGNLIRNGTRTYRRVNLRHLREAQQRLSAAGNVFLSVPERAL